MSGFDNTIITAEAIGVSITDPPKQRAGITAAADEIVAGEAGKEPTRAQHHENSIDVLNYLMRTKNADGPAQRVEVIMEMQRGLGFTGNDVDGKFGPKTAAAFAKGLEGVDRSRLTAEQLKTIEAMRDDLANSLNDPNNEKLYGHGKVTRDVTLYQALSNFLNAGDRNPLSVTGKLDTATLAHLNAGHLTDGIRQLPADGRAAPPATAPYIPPDP